MGKPITHDFEQSKTILKFFPFQGAACLVPAANVVADANGNKIVKAGTPFPANNETCLGYLLSDVDVTQGDAPGTYVYEGTIDPAKLTANGIIVTDAAKAHTPRVYFYGEAYKSGGTSTSTSA